MSFLKRIFGRTDRRRSLDPLYRAVVAEAREPGWYREGQVPDTVDGRFDMVATVTGLVLLRLEAEGEAGREPSALLAELFVEDMDASLRQIGVGDYVVGKHIGRMMSALGGRLGSLRSEREEGGDYRTYVRHNVFHDTPPSEGAVEQVASRLGRMGAALDAQPVAELLAGRMPTL